MKKNNFTIFLGLLFTALIIASCEDDKKEEVSPYIGDYTIESAILTETVSIPVVVGENEINFPLPAETDITEMIQNSLLNALPCGSPEASLIEMREDQSLYMSCSDKDFEIDAGTWEEKENGTVLILNFNSKAIPSSPTGFSLTVKDVKLEDNMLSSNTTVPIPKVLIAAMVEAGGMGAVLSESAPDIFLFTFDMELKKVK